MGYRKSFKKNKKIFSLVGVLFVLAIIVNIISIITSRNNHIENVSNNSTEDNISVASNEFNKDLIDDGSLDFYGKAYKPSKVYNENNEEVRLSDFSEKPIALIFFDIESEESINALKIYQEHFETYSNDINVLGICMLSEQKSIEDAKNFLGDDIAFPILYDCDSNAKNEYSIEKIPTYVFINEKNQIINTVNLDINEDVITANLDILSKNY